ncbi:sulfite exporter TauE/SafE family protein [Aquimarina rhabdastrellae]
MIATAFILGLLGSFHCIGMCGPIALMLPVDRTNAKKKFFQITLYHSGRLLAYSVLGLVFGWIGKSLHLFGLQQYLSIGIGILMILVILLPHTVFNRYNFSKPIATAIMKIKSALGKELQKKTTDTFLTIGFLNGFLPCGLIYIAIFGAIATGNPLQSSAYMLLFGLGTIPLLSVIIYVSDLITQKVKYRIRKIIPVFVILMGLLFILRGMGLGIPYVSPKQESEMISSNMKCH